MCPDQVQPGFTYAGSFAEQVVVHAAGTNLVRLPDGVALVAAAALGGRFATAFRALTGVAGVRAGEWVAVFGCGGVGLSAVMIASALDARVVAVDVSAAARDRALELGAEVALPAEGAAAAIVELAEGGAHVGLDALGSVATLDASVRSLRRHGRHVQVGLLLGDAAGAGVPWDLVVGRELRLAGSHGMAAVDYPAMLAMVADGRLDPGRLVGRVITLDEAGAALAAMDDPSSPAAGMTVVSLAERPVRSRSRPLRWPARLNPRCRRDPTGTRSSTDRASDYGSEGWEFESLRVRIKSSGRTAAWKASVPSNLSASSAGRDGVRRPDGVRGHHQDRR